ncbi:hypothetical protein GCM10009745_39490 [Kribbella yunnanensis]|uniref:Uncharacterized protein n=1 Tax=Kribbella yunnanensis TaxID=190194 RepID=A0ABP4TN56_9ACTN
MPCILARPASSRPSPRLTVITHQLLQRHRVPAWDHLSDCGYWVMHVRPATGGTPAAQNSYPFVRLQLPADPKHSTIAVVGRAQA